MDNSKIIEEIHQKQASLNQKYKEEGLTDEILEKQVELNTLKNQYNISDKCKRIHENYVQ